MDFNAPQPNLHSWYRKGHGNHIFPPSFTEKPISDKEPKAG